MAAVTWVAEAADGRTLGADPVVLNPGLAVNDLMLAVGATSGAQTLTPPAGWGTHPDSISTARPLYYKFADASDVAAASFTFVASGASNAAVVISVYRNVSLTNPFVGTAGSVSTASTSVSISAAVPTGSCFLAQIVLKMSNNTWTPPGTVSPERWDHTVGSVIVASTAGGHETVAAGSTGIRTWVASAGAGAGVGYSVGLRQSTIEQSLSAVMDGTPLLSKKTTKLMTAIVDGTGSLASKLTAFRAMSAIADGTPNSAGVTTRYRTVDSVMDGTGSVTPRTMFSRVLTSIMNGTGSVLRMVPKQLSAIMNGSGILNRRITAFREMISIVSGTADMTKLSETHRTILAVMDGPTALIPRANKLLLAVMDGSDVLIRKIAAFRALTGIMDGEPSIVRKTGRTLSTIVNGVSALTRTITISRTFIAVADGSPSVTMALQIARTMSAIMNGVPFGFVKFPWGSIPTSGAVTYIRSLFVFDD
jgi:hypothetical protein